MKWSLLTDWAAGNGPAQHLPVGSVIEGVCDRFGNLTAIRWQGEYFGPALPQEAMALDQPAADELARQHPEHLHLLRALAPAVIRPYDTTHPFRAYERAEMAKAANARLEEIHWEEYPRAVKAEAEAHDRRPQP
jgi:hypothetical protein